MRLLLLVAVALLLVAAPAPACDYGVQQFGVQQFYAAPQLQFVQPQLVSPYFAPTLQLTAPVTYGYSAPFVQTYSPAFVTQRVQFFTPVVPRRGLRLRFLY